MPSKKIRWLHLSDFHVGMDDYAEREIFVRIIDHVKDKIKNGFNPDLIFVTGDIADKGKTDQFDLFNKEFLLPLFDVVGNECDKRTFIIPGNHDVERSKSPFFSREDMCASKSRFFYPNNEGKELRRQIQPRFENYEKNVWSASPLEWVSSEKGTFSQILEVREIKVGIVGINTSWLCKDNDERHKLTPGRPLVESALDDVANCDVRIVLGHHPIDWFLDREVSEFRALFGKHRVIYLHGHLHEVRCLPEDGSGKPFLSIQCGAGFQTRAGDIWRNGLLWGELDLEAEEICLQPKHWEPNNHDWPTTTGAFPEIRKKDNSDWWGFPMPQEKSQAAINAQKQQKAHLTKIPDGWQLLTKDGLLGLGAALDEQTAIRFFNGANPTWQLAVSASIPRRNIVYRLTEFLNNNDVSDRPRVALLLAASGEGKSTALLQTIYEIASQGKGWNILRRSDETQPVSVDDIISIVTTKGPWLIVTDEADQVAKYLFTLVKLLQQRGRTDVHFLIASRDSDWIAAKGYADNWWGHSNFIEERLHGLDNQDAEKIVTAWANFGNAALGRLSKMDYSAAVQALLNAAKDESKMPDGSFFGAMLTVRFGDDLQEHLKLLLQRFAARNIPGGATLQDAVGFVAAMHTIDFPFLSRPILARVLGCSLKDLKRHVLLPLGEEAAATTTSQFIFTRHRRIAKSIMEVLSAEFGEDTDTYYEEMAGAAMDSFQDGDYIPLLSDWRYTLANKLAELGRNDLAIRVSRAILRREPNNTKTMVKLAQLYREASSPEEAVSLFRNFHGEITNNRAFFTEWGISEGIKGDIGGSIWLMAYSLSDQCAIIPPDNVDAKIVLRKMCIEFDKLYRLYNNPIYLNGKAGAATLGLLFSSDNNELKLEFQAALDKSTQDGAQVLSIDNSFTTIQEAAKIAADICGAKEIIERVPVQSVLTLTGFKQLIGFVRLRIR